MSLSAFLLSSSQDFFSPTPRHSVAKFSQPLLWQDVPVSKFSSEKWLDGEIGSEMTNLALHSQGRARKFFNIKRIKNVSAVPRKKKEKKSVAGSVVQRESAG